MSVLEAVPPSKLRAALALLVGGESPTASRKVDQFEKLLIGPEAAKSTFWWARTPDGPQVAVLIVHTPGRVGMVFHGPPYSRQQELLASLIDRTSREALAQPLSLVQALLEESAVLARQAYLQAGFVDLARLAYLQRRLEDAADLPASLITYRTPPKFSLDELAALLEQTYEDSLDCPGLQGLRRSSDIIVSHQNTGVYDPALWRIAFEGSEPIGCVLMNVVSPANRSVEVVYIGLRKAWRGRGLGRQMLQDAMALAHAKGQRSMYLAADASNVPAMGLYRSLGFVPLQHRLVLIRANREISEK